MGHYRNDFDRARIPACLVAVFCALPVSAQYPSNNRVGSVRLRETASLTSRVDLYGNARPLSEQRRMIGGVYTSAQFNALRGYQEIGRRSFQRGGATQFGLPSDFPTMLSDRLPRVGWSQTLTPLGVSPLLQQAFREYGGFMDRPRRGMQGDLSFALRRRNMLIYATALNAPVQRAVLTRGFQSALPERIEHTPFIQPEEGEDAPDLVTLDQLLRRGSMDAYAEMQQQAWGFLKLGEYQGAARAFGIILNLVPGDLNARLGEVFCHVSLTNMRTASVALKELAARDPDLFGHELDMNDWYPNEQEVRRVRALAQLSSQGGSGPIKAIATYAFVLWYIGERDEAVRQARTLRRGDDSESFSTWYNLMQSKITAGASPDGNP